jgi:hypothetical protein
VSVDPEDLYLSVEKNEDGTVELTVFEEGHVAGITMSRDQVSALIDNLKECIQ